MGPVSALQEAASPPFSFPDHTRWGPNDPSVHPNIAPQTFEALSHLMLKKPSTSISRY